MSESLRLIVTRTSIERNAVKDGVVTSPFSFPPFQFNHLHQVSVTSPPCRKPDGLSHPNTRDIKVFLFPFSEDAGTPWRLRGVSGCSVEEATQVIFYLFIFFYCSTAEESPWKRVVCIFRSLTVCVRVQPAGCWANKALGEFVCFIL